MDWIARAIEEHAPAPGSEPEPPFRRAAVAMVLREQPQGPELLMIKRAEHPGDPWSGHMAFPGGKQDPGDPDPLDTARRETLEELSLPLNGARMLGELSPVRTPKVRIDGRKPLVVHGYVFDLAGPLPDLRPNHEVASVHWFALGRMLAGEGRSTFTYEWRGRSLELPCFRLDGQLIWGMSLGMIDDLLRRLRRARP